MCACVLTVCILVLNNYVCECGWVGVCGSGFVGVYGVHTETGSN